MLELIHIKKAFKNKRVLNDINLTFESKGFVALTGESGSGKTTLINIISGVENADSGDLIYDGKKMIFEKESERIKAILKYVSYMSQSQILLYNKTVYENLKEILNLYNIEDENEINVLLNRVHLNETYKNRIVSTLSTGEAQRICIAISLLKKSNILILDEATENLDPTNRELILSILKEISQEKLVILVTHDIVLVKKYIDRLITISNGDIYSDETYTNELVILGKEVEDEHVKGKRKKRLNFPFKNILFYFLIPLIMMFFVAQLSIWIKPNIPSEYNYPNSYYQKIVCDESGNIYAENFIFTKNELKVIFDDEDTYLIFNQFNLFDDFIKGAIDYDFNYKHSKELSIFGEYIVSKTFLELNPTFKEKYTVIEIIEIEKPVVLINYEIIWNHFFPNVSINFDSFYQAFQESFYVKTQLTTKNAKKTISLGLPIENCYQKTISNYYKDNSLSLYFGTIICSIMIYLSAFLYIVLANKQVPYYYKTIAFYRVCGQTNLEIRKKLKMEFYVYPLILIVICSIIAPLAVLLIVNKTGYNRNIFRFDLTNYWITFVISFGLLIALNELMNFIILKTKLKKMIKSRQI